MKGAVRGGLLQVQLTYVVPEAHTNGAIRRGLPQQFCGCFDGQVVGAGTKIYLLIKRKTIDGPLAKKKSKKTNDQRGRSLKSVTAEPDFKA